MMIHKGFQVPVIDSVGPITCVSIFSISEYCQLVTGTLTDPGSKEGSKNFKKLYWLGNSQNESKYWLCGNYTDSDSVFIT